MKQALTTISILITLSLLGQTNIDLSGIDSANIQVYNHTSKEMVTNESDAGWVLLGQKTLSLKHINKFKGILTDPANFSEDRALLTHDNVQVYFYSKGKLILDFHLSTFTRNMFIEDGKVHRTWSITPAAEKKIKKLLKKLKLYKLIDPAMRFPKVD
ncbi:MAG: hypothetical protein ABJG68_09315 [Crocinitomicaceae bacterium]